MEYADRGNLADALRSERFPCHDYTAVYRCLLDIAAGIAHTRGLPASAGCCKPASLGSDLCKGGIHVMPLMLGPQDLLAQKCDIGHAVEDLCLSLCSQDAPVGPC